MIGYCNEHKVSEKGIAYISECLEYGKSLGKQLATLINRESGHITALLPQDVDSKETPDLLSEYRFRYGGIGSRVGGTLTCLAKTVYQFLIEDADHICIIEDTIVLREDGWIESSDAPLLFLDNDVYWFLSSKHCDNLERIQRILSALDGERVTGILTSLPSERKPLREKQDITLKDINEFTERTEMIIIDAFDGEGYLIWRRTQ